ncbi:hypothetical protein PHMEG_00018414 [Phytophthora megakarya]|uniref:Uncharacterized protein n=1 Tax=Phytophthora megakarya TaxID=4795 RepID=A0A225VWM9_9STRA|nr:hypothetical protein PHMEG_00018414 [Phytophthora megakarya]
MHRIRKKSLNLESHVIDLLTAKLIQHVPEVNDRYPMSPYASRLIDQQNIVIAQLIEDKRELSFRVPALEAPGNTGDAVACDEPRTDE